MAKVGRPKSKNPRNYFVRLCLTKDVYDELVKQAENKVPPTMPASLAAWIVEQGLNGGNNG